MLYSYINIYQNKSVASAYALSPALGHCYMKSGGTIARHRACVRRTC
jgi:hypothetical protein